MNIQKSDIDGGKPFDWGKTSADYARFRDIYPAEFYEALTSRGLCTAGQQVLDLGTGTGVLPRNMYRFGAAWTGTDISENQIEQAKRLAAEQGMNIRFAVSSAEDLPYAPQSFDVITACQCFWYFDPAVIAPKLAALLKPAGRLVILQMNWLPDEDSIANASEQLVLEFNPAWTGAGYQRQPVCLPAELLAQFEPVEQLQFDLQVPFTRESWHGRMRACRGVGASLSASDLAAWETAHRSLLCHAAPSEFTVLHEAAIAVLKPKHS